MKYDHTYPTSSSFNSLHILLPAWPLNFYLTNHWDQLILFRCKWVLGQVSWIPMDGTLYLLDLALPYIYYMTVESCFYENILCAPVFSFKAKAKYLHQGRKKQLKERREILMAVIKLLCLVKVRISHSRLSPQSGKEFKSKRTCSCKIEEMEQWIMTLSPGTSWKMTWLY